MRKQVDGTYFLFLLWSTFIAMGCNPNPPLFLRSINKEPIPFNEQYIKASVEFLDPGSPLVIDSVTLPMADSTTFKLQKSYPSPFSPSTSFEFYVPSYDSVQLSIYDVHGANIGKIFNGCLPQGHFKLVVTDSHVNSGIYLLRSVIANTTSIKKFLLLK
jgi:hypothetical protein